MENLLVLLHIGRQHNNTTNCPDRKRWQYSCGKQSCRLCFQGSLDLRGQIRSSAAGLLGWTVLVKGLVDRNFELGHLGSFRVNLVKCPCLDDLDHLTTLTECGGAILPSQVDLAQMMVKRTRMGSKAPKIRVVVGKYYGKNANGTCKPIRAMLEGRVEISNL